jgi:excisionase family DNA binding protein
MNKSSDLSQPLGKKRLNQLFDHLEAITMANNSTQSTPLAVRPKEAARLLAISERKLSDLLKDGTIPSRKIGGGRAGAVLISVAVLQAWIAGDADTSTQGEN